MPQIVGIGMVRELGPVLVGLMIAARVTSSIAAEIATMKVTEQIDALVSRAGKYDTAIVPAAPPAKQAITDDEPLTDQEVKLLLAKLRPRLQIALRERGRLLPRAGHTHRHRLRLCDAHDAAAAQQLVSRGAARRRALVRRAQHHRESTKTNSRSWL